VPSSNASTSSYAHGGKSPIKGVKPGAAQGNKYKRSSTISSVNRNVKTHLKGTKEVDESFMMEKEGDGSFRKDSLPHKGNSMVDNPNIMNKSGSSGAKSPVFDPNKFDLKQMGTHTFEFLSILEHEFDSIYNILAEMYNQNDHSRPTAQHRQGMAKPHGTRGVSMDREIQPTKASPPKNTSKITAYQMLKALTRREDEVPPKEEGPSQQEILSRPPLVQIRPQGIRVATIQPSSQGQAYLPQLPQRSRLGSDNFVLEKEFGDGHAQMNNSMRTSPQRVRATHGNVKLFGAGPVQPQYAKDGKLNDSSFDVLSSTGKDLLDNDKEDTVFAPYPSDNKMMQEMPLVRQRAATNTQARDNAEKAFA